MSQSFWTTLASYCNELAPVTGPLLSAVADTAHAVERASNQTTALNASSSRTLRASLICDDPD